MEALTLCITLHRLAHRHNLKSGRNILENTVYRAMVDLSSDRHQSSGASVIGHTTPVHFSENRGNPGDLKFPQNCTYKHTCVFIVSCLFLVHQCSFTPSTSQVCNECTTTLHSCTSVPLLFAGRAFSALQPRDRKRDLSLSHCHF